MTGDIQCFFVNLVKHYYNQMDIYYMLASPIKKDENIERDIEYTREFAKEKEWLSHYLVENDTVNYFEIFKKYIEYLDEADSQQVLKIFKAYEAETANNLNQEIRKDFKNNGYSLYLGSHIIKKLIHFYDEDKSIEISFVDWLKPVDISNLQNDAYYLVDDQVFNETFVRPILVSKESMEKFRIEKGNQSFDVLPNVLSLYFEHLIVTKRGIESEERVSEALIEVSYYNNITHYEELHAYGSRDATFRKLLKSGVIPSMPFLELVVDGFGEYYINDFSLKTERDIINFVNQSYYAEELDREAKSFDRNKILETVLNKNRKIHSHFNYEYVENLSRNK